MLEQKIQGEINQLIIKIEEIAVEMELKMRFLDGIRDVKKTLKRSLSQQELRKVVLEIDELIVQIRKQIEPEQKEVIVNESVTVTEADIKNNIQKILTDASKINPTLFMENVVGSETYIQETEQAIRDFAKTEANYEIISDVRRLHEKFDYIGKRHNQNMNHIIEPYIDEVAVNYDNCVSRIGKMLSGIKDSRLTFRQKELYQKWSEGSHAIKNKVKEEAEQIDKGRNVIIDFISERENELEKITKKIKRKYFIKKGIPLYILLFIIFLIVKFIIGIFTSIAELIGTTVDGVISLIQEGSLDGVINIVSEKFGGKLDEYLLNLVTEALLPEGAGAAAGAATGAGAAATAGATSFLTVLAVGMAIVLVVFAFIWYLWIKYQNKKCKKQICKKTGKYLNEQLEIFWRDKPLHKQLEKSCDVLVKKVTTTYETSMMQIFGGILYNETEDNNSSVYKMLQLCNEWEKIKRGNL